MPRQRIRILLVEDDPDNVWVMRNLLGRPLGRPLRAGPRGVAFGGHQRCKEGSFDIILLDLTLPDSRGLETFFVMHAHAADVPIVVLSGYDDETAAIKAVQAGAKITS